MIFFLSWSTAIGWHFVIQITVLIVCHEVDLQLHDRQQTCK
jgi:hypothetical protein